VVEDDPVNLQCGLHRMLLGLLDIMASGFVMFLAEGSLDESGACTLNIEAAGSGAMCPPAEMDAVLQRLHLANVPGRAGSGQTMRQAEGVCPNTGAALRFASDPPEGVLLQMRLAYAQGREGAPEEAAQADGARAWLIDESPVFSDGGERRLQRLGWRVTRFRSCEGALARANGLASADAGVAPALLIVVDSPAIDAHCLEALQAQLPTATRRVLAVAAGSVWLGQARPAANFDVRVFPLSPFELQQLAESALPHARSREPRAFGPPHASGGPPLVLVVDDNDINRIVGRGLVEALGYEVRTANDGLDAIDQCRLMPPQVVLMDLSMPVLGGLEATRRLRELQRSGGVPPFAVIAATADGSVTAQRACEAVGMDAVITKPLNMALLRDVLRRFTSAAHAAPS